MARLRSLLSSQRLTLLGVAFVVAGSAVAYGDTGFPFLGMEFAGLLGLATLAALILAVPLAFRPGGRAAVFAVGVTFFLDVAYVGPGFPGGISIALLAAYLTYLIAWRNNDTVVPLATTAVAVSVAFILPQQALSNANLTPAKFELTPGGADAEGRPYVHIILDEMSSLDMMPKGPFYDALKRRMVEDYRRRGFDLFGDTVAASGVTVVSLGDVFTENDGDEGNFEPIENGFAHAIRQNRVTEMLAGSGYAVTALQSGYLDICRSGHLRCFTYSSSGDGAELRRRTTSDADSVQYALRVTNLLLLLNDSTRSSIYYRLAGRLAAHLGVSVPQWRLHHLRPPQTITLMQTAAEGLRELDKGEAALLHLLVPHFPYMLDEQCRVKSPDAVRAPKWGMEHLGKPFSLVAVERAYWEQAACVHDTLMETIDAILESPGGEDAVVLVHGDHGSRLLKKLTYPKREAASDSERRYALLAHFAVRGVNDRHDQLAAHTGLRERVSIVLQAALDGPEPEQDLLTSATR